MRKLVLTLGHLFLTVISLAKTEILVVRFQTTALRSEPRFFSVAKAPLKAGDQREKLEFKEGWYRVKTPSGAVG